MLPICILLFSLSAQTSIAIRLASFRSQIYCYCSKCYLKLTFRMGYELTTVRRAPLRLKVYSVTCRQMNQDSSLLLSHATLEKSHSVESVLFCRHPALIIVTDVSTCSRAASVERYPSASNSSCDARGAMSQLTITACCPYAGYPRAIDRWPVSVLTGCCSASLVYLPTAEQ